ncbi:MULTISPECIES: DoxX family protein [unclassified Streptomyces]|uniref:DoxX family protein n=1 Tax=unclassified Streptomyces TaxID=2593676 RepID=UPI002256475E|nr:MULTISPECIES: DoxX family protein [unclassified Streptomyces]MCX4831120.1 DoxX family protein [Streptomyces sp. NBC_01016]
MSTTVVIVTVLTALWVGFSGVSLLRRAEFVVDPLVSYGVPETWWPRLAVAKLLGAAGLLAGLAVPAVGIAAAIALVLYFVGAVVTVLRARSYKTVAFPVLYLAPVVATLAVGL